MSIYWNISNFLQFTSLDFLYNRLNKSKTFLQFRESGIFATLVRIVISATDVAYRNIQPTHLQFDHICFASTDHFISILLQESLGYEVRVTQDGVPLSITLYHIPYVVKEGQVTCSCASTTCKFATALCAGCRRILGSVHV